MKKVEVTNEMREYGGSDPKALKEYMQYNFPFYDFRMIGFFTKEMKGDYYAQAKRVCEYFKLKSVFEYENFNVPCHLSRTKSRKGN